MATAIPTNRAAFTVAEIQAATGAALVQPGDPSFVGVATDTREVVAGNVFVALRGERHDAHAFVPAAVAAGARAVLVESDVVVPAGVAVFRVASTLRALGDLAHLHRRRLAARVVAITGSVGKTTTKEMVAELLTELGERVHRTEGNLNNLIGLPRTILAAGPDVTVLVLEAGMNVPGEIARLTEIAAPDVGVVTAVSEAHTEGVGGLEGVAREKGALLRGLGASGVAVATADDVVLAPHLQATPASRSLTFGRVPSSVRIVSRVATRHGSHVVCDVSGTRVEVPLSFLGEGAARNAAAALAVGLALRGEDGLRAAGALARVTPPPGRMQIGPGAFGTLLIDDSYNASPRAVENALEAAADVARQSAGRVIAVLGDMLELGAQSEELHARVGECVARIGTSLFCACGRSMATAAEEARELGCDLVQEFADPMEAIGPVRLFMRMNDVVVVKGSRGMRMERVVEALRTSAESPLDDAEAEKGAA